MQWVAWVRHRRTRVFAVPYPSNRGTGDVFLDSVSFVRAHVLLDAHTGRLD